MPHVLHSKVPKYVACVEYFYKPSALYINDSVITQNIPYFIEVTLEKFTF